MRLDLQKKTQTLTLRVWRRHMCSVVKFASLSIELRLCRSSLISRRLLLICSKYVTLSVPTYDRYLAYRGTFLNWFDYCTCYKIDPRTAGSWIALVLSTLTKKVRTVVILRSFDSHAVIALDRWGWPSTVVRVTLVTKCAQWHNERVACRLIVLLRSSR